MLRRIKNVPAEVWVGLTIPVLILAILLPLFIHTMSFTIVLGDSMVPTLQNGDFYVATSLHDIHAGDIVIVDSAFLDQIIIKRVVAMPGDTVAITDNTVYRNGIPLQEAYIEEQMHTENMPSFTLQEEMFFLMGDNRNNSLDSRMIGPVHRDEIRYVVPQQSQPELMVLYIALIVSIALLTERLSNWGTDCIMKVFFKKKPQESAPDDHDQKEDYV